MFHLSATRFKLLHAACAGHTHGRTHPDNTVRTCWDADRLDLGRVGITPLPRLLCTEVARREDTIRWAHERAASRRVPEFVREDWRVHLPSLDEPIGQEDGPRLGNSPAMRLLGDNPWHDAPIRC